MESIKKVFIISNVLSRYSAVEQMVHTRFSNTERIQIQQIPHPFCSQYIVQKACSHKQTCGDYSLATAHAMAWNYSVSSNTNVVVFEDDATSIDNNISWQWNADMILLGYCHHFRQLRCTHAYAISPNASKQLLESWSNCKPVDVITSSYCLRHGCQTTKRNKRSVPSFWGEGIIRQNRSLPNYIHHKTDTKTYHNTSVLH